MLRKKNILFKKLSNLFSYNNLKAEQDKKTAFIKDSKTQTNDINIENLKDDEMNEIKIHENLTIDPIKSLFYKYRNIDDLSTHNIQLKQLKILEEGAYSESGPKHLLIQDQIDKINLQADLKLDEIAESGMSREEILNIDSRGIPLKADPFFLLIKNDHTVRFNHFDDKEEYSVDKIITLAVNQGIELDRSASGTGKRIIDDGNFNPVKEFDRDTLEDTNIIKNKEIEDYYITGKEPREEEYSSHHILEDYRPIERVEKQEVELDLDPKEIHWRNTRLLARFMTNYGTIKHRKLTKLKTSTHKKVEKAIKQARNLNLLPTKSFLKEHHKLPLRSLEDDIIDDENYEVDLESGAIFKKDRNLEDYDFNKDYFKHSLTYFDAREMKNKKTEDLEKERIISEATEYAVYLKIEYLKGLGVNVNENNLTNYQMKKVHKNNFNLENVNRLKTSYNMIKDSFKNVSFVDFLDLILAEEMKDVERLSELKEMGDDLNQIKKETNNWSYEKLLSDIQNSKNKIDRNKFNISNDFFNNKEELSIVESIK